MAGRTSQLFRHVRGVGVPKLLHAHKHGNLDTRNTVEWDLDVKCNNSLRIWDDRSFHTSWDARTNLAKLSPQEVSNSLA